MADVPTPQLRPFLASDIAAARALWERSEGIGLNESDSEEAIARFLLRNPGMSAVATSEGGELLGAVLCGHDGRRGYLHHLAVADSQRRRGLGRQLVGYCFERLAAEGIPRCNIFVYDDNRAGLDFWLHDGWREASWKTLQKRVPTAEDKG